MREKLRRDRGGYFGRLHRIDEKKFNWTMFPVRSSEIFIVHHDVVSPFPGAFQELGQKSPARREHPFDLCSLGPLFVAFIPGKKIVDMYLLRFGRCPV